MRSRQASVVQPRFVPVPAGNGGKGSKSRLRAPGVRQPLTWGRAVIQTPSRTMNTKIPSVQTAFIHMIMCSGLRRDLCLRDFWHQKDDIRQKSILPYWRIRVIKIAFVKQVYYHIKLHIFGMRNFKKDKAQG